MPERYLGSFLGRFRIDSLIGSGGFAWVYRGYDPELDIPVAVKVLKPQFAGDEAFEGRFRREASTAAKLRHPNIVRILTVGRQGDAVYSVMDFLPSGLVERLKVQGALTNQQVIRLGMDVADALAFAHREGVIHRDIKVDNIMYDDHGHAVVVDFGIARATAGYVQQTGTGMVVGTPQYFSPEQARGLPLDGRADLYSLGVTLFKAATGRLPFEGDDWYEMARMHVEEPPPHPREINPTLAPEVEDVILCLLEKDREKRLPDGDAVREALAALLPAHSAAPVPGTSNTPAAIQISTAKRARTIRRLRQTARDHMLALGVVGAAVLAVLVAMGRNRASAANGDDRTPVGDSAAAPLPDVRPGSVTPIAPPPVGVAEAPRVRTTASLHVRAPSGVPITVNGTVVGRGSWQSDSLAPAEYEIAASVSAIDGCRTARDRKHVKLDAGDNNTVTLAPRACGTILLSSSPTGADYELTPAAGVATPTGRLVASRLLTVPVGSYHVTAKAPRCANYESAQPIVVGPGERRERNIKLICSP